LEGLDVTDPGIIQRFIATSRTGEYSRRAMTGHAKWTLKDKIKALNIAEKSSIAEASQETGVPFSTLAKWKQESLTIFAHHVEEVEKQAWKYGTSSDAYAAVCWLTVEICKGLAEQLKKGKLQNPEQILNILLDQKVAFDYLAQMSEQGKLEPQQHSTTVQILNAVGNSTKGD
jgi:hypothetical protein